MSIVIKSKKIKEDIVNENGDIIATISFNPEDSKSYTKLSDIINNIYKIKDNIDKNQPEIKELPKRDLELDELDEYRTSFEKINETFHYQEDMLKQIFEDFDYVFGNGTCNAIMEGSYDISMLMPIIEYAKPHFEKARSKKVGKYISKDTIEQLDVME